MTALEVAERLNDTETTLIQDLATIPHYVIASVCDGQRVYFDPRHYFGEFWAAHQASVVYMHRTVPAGGCPCRLKSDFVSIPVGNRFGTFYSASGGKP